MSNTTTPSPQPGDRPEESPHQPTQRGPVGGQAVGRWLRSRTTWVAVVFAGLAGSIMAFSYIGGLVDPVGHQHDAPIGVVNLDAGASADGQSVAAGDELQDKLTSTETHMFDWQVLDTREEAERRLRNNTLWGAIVVPESFSSDIVDIGASPDDADPASLVVLTNEGSGNYQTAAFQELYQSAVEEASHDTAEMLAQQLDQAGVTISPDAAAVVGQPVVSDVHAVVELPDKAGRGIAPFYLTIIVTLTGFLAANLTSIGTDLLRGRQQLAFMGRHLNLAVADGRPGSAWAFKVIGTVLAAALGGALAVFTAHGIVGMDLDSPLKAYGWAMLCAATIGMITLVFLSVFGLVGQLLGVLFTTIFGVPSALAIYPKEALPGFFEFLSSWHPMRYVSDGMRSIAFYDGTGAGLGKALVVMLIWLVAAFIVGSLVAWWSDRRHPLPSDPAPTDRDVTPAAAG